MLFKYLSFIILGVLHLSSIHANNFAYLIVDGKSGKVLAQHRADELRPPASLTKIMTLYLIFEALHAGKITLQTQFRVSKLATQQEPCNLGLGVGAKISVRDIIYALVTRSANDMSITIAEGLSGSVEAFMVLMNKKTKKLGLRCTKFNNMHGLPSRGQVTSARDMMILSMALYRDFPKEYAFFKIKEFRYNGRPVRNHNRMLKSFPGMDGIKTGFTFASRFNISASAERMGRDGNPMRVFAVVLGGQTSVSRDKKTAELMEVAFNKINSMPRMRQTDAKKAMVQSFDDGKDAIGELVEQVDATPVRVTKPRVQKSTVRADRQKKVEAKAVTHSKSVVFNDPIDEILSASVPISVDINRDLPAGWVKANPN